MNSATRWASFVLMTLFTVVGARGQFLGFTPYIVPNSSLDWPISPRGVALGGATVALPGYGDAFASNPAGLAGCTGLWAEYSQQPFFVNNEDMRYRSWSVGGQTPFGTFSASYRRLDLGDLILTLVDSPEISGELESFNYAAGIGWGYALGNGVQVGVTLTTYDEVYRLESGHLTPQAGFLIPETKRPYTIDFGMLLNTGVLFASGRDSDNLSFGFAAQGFGSPFRKKYTIPENQVIFDSVGSPHMISTTHSEEYVQPLPRNFRIGVSYQYLLRSPSPEIMNPLSVALMAEYRAILNAQMGLPGTYWGVGLEVTVDEMVHLWLGGEAPPYESVYGYENTLHGRYGVGLSIPFARLFDGVQPFTLEAGYSVFPLVGDDFSAVRSFSLGLRYLPGP